MKLVYISPLRYPSQKAGSLFSMKSCEAFANEGVEVELWVPRRRATDRNADVFGYFGVHKSFKIKYFPTLDLTGFWDGGYHLLYYSFALSVFLYSLGLRIFEKMGNRVFYSHEQFALFLLTFLTRHTFYEMHDFPGLRKIYHLFFKRIRGVVSTNFWKGEELWKRFSLPKSKIYAVANAVDLRDFSQIVSVEEARKKLNLQPLDYLFGYVGTLKTMGMEKGVSTAIESLQFLPAHFKLYVIGGGGEDLAYYKGYAEKLGFSNRIIFAGFFAHNEIAVYTSACNVLIAPFPKNDHYSYHMSPMKIFEYMASKRPIVASDLPSLREILTDGKTALLVSPGAPESLAQAILRLQTDSALGSALSQTAYREVIQKHTWQKRASKIIDFIENTRYMF